MGRIFALAALALLAGACGADSARERAMESSTTATQDERREERVGSESRLAVPDTVGLGELEAARWRLTGRLRPESTSISLAYESGECVGSDKPAEPRFARAEVSYSANAVVITVYERPALGRPQGDGSFACAGVGVIVRREVKLREPLGNRALKDGSRDPPSVVRPPFS